MKKDLTRGLRLSKKSETVKIKRFYGSVMSFYRYKPCMLIFAQYAIKRQDL